MLRQLPLILILLFLNVTYLIGQTTKEVVDQLKKEAIENSQLEQLAHELMDVIGPRLVGTPQMTKAHDWAVATFNKWGIDAQNEEWGTWRGWERCTRTGRSRRSPVCTSGAPKLSA